MLVIGCVSHHIMSHNIQMWLQKRAASLLQHFSYTPHSHASRNAPSSYAFCAIASQRSAAYIPSINSIENHRGMEDEVKKVEVQVLQSQVSSLQARVSELEAQLNRRWYVSVCEQLGFLGQQGSPEDGLWLAGRSRATCQTQGCISWMWSQSSTVRRVRMHLSW